MSKCSEILSSINFEKIIIHIAQNINTLDSKLNDEFHNYIDSENIEFLKKVKGLSNLNNPHKIKAFNDALQFVAVILFNKYLLNMKIDIGVDNLSMIHYDYKELVESGIIPSILPEITNLSSADIRYVLQELYVDAISLVSRKNSGTEFTPIDIVKFMFNTIEYKGLIITESKLLEPACGSGIFLVEAMKRICATLLQNNAKIGDLKKLIIEKKVITGFDINPANVFISKLLIIIEISDNFHDINGEDIVKLFKEMPIKTQNGLKVDEESSFDYVIGNPPYIRLQNLPMCEREYIKHTFDSATGRFDTYVCFIEKAIKLLKENGRMSLITSNKYFTANYGNGIREFIRDNLEITLLFDLHDTKFFEAAVLPAIISGCKKINPDNSDFAYFHIKQDNTSNDVDNYRTCNIFDLILSMKESDLETKDFYKITNNTTDLLIEFVHSKEKLPDKKLQWNFGSKYDIEIKKYIEMQNVELLKDIADVCVGIKTTADDVFVKPMTKTFVKERQFEKDIIYPLIQSQNISKWLITWDESNPKDRFILYPHEQINSKMVAVDLEDFPNAQKYILENEAVLKGRRYLMESNTRKWYECWVPQHLSKFKQAKIVTKDIVSINSFALDYSGRLCQGNTFFINLKKNLLTQNIVDDDIYLRYLVGVLNSDIMEFYQKCISGSLYSKKYRYTTTNLNRWPIPKITQENLTKVKKIVKLVGNLILDDGNSKEKLEQQLNETVYKLYNITESYIKDINIFLKVNR